MNRASHLRHLAAGGLLIAYCIQATAFLSATAIVTFIRDNAIYLAADSGLEPSPSPACKIAKGPHVALALSGVVRGRILPVGGEPMKAERVDLLAVARRVAENARTIAEAIEMFTNESRLFLNVIAQDNGAPLDLIAAGFENGVPSVVVVGYRRTLSGTRFIVTPRPLHRCPPRCAAEGTPWAFGEVDQLTLARGFDGLPAETRRDPVRTAEALLTQQMDARKAEARERQARTGQAEPDVIKPPFAVLKITSDSSNWAQRTPPCDAAASQQ